MVWTSANGPKCPVSPADRGEYMKPARIDKRNAERSQAMAREAAETMAAERVRLEGSAHTRPDGKAAT